MLEEEGGVSKERKTTENNSLILQIFTRSKQDPPEKRKRGKSN